MNKDMINSGIDWINYIPSDWGLKRLGAIFEYVNKKNSNREETNILSLMKDIGVIPYSEKGAVGNNASESIERYFLVEPNDIVMNSMNVIIGSVGKSNYFGCLSQVYHVLRVREKDDSFVDYYDYLFATRDFQRKLVGYGNGILEHRMRIPMSKLKTVLLPKPLFIEQQAIANFLDDKTQKIDELINLQETAIERLEEYKQSVITEAVTKGLDSNIEMKDSGIEWIGKIPKNWKLSRLKYSYKIIMGQSPSSSSYNDLEVGLPFLGGNADVLDRESKPRFYTSEITKICQIGDILMSVRAPVGTISKSKHKACIGRGLCAIRSKDFNNYLYYYMVFLENKWNSFITGTTFDSINQKDVKEMYCISLNEETRLNISNYLDKKTEEINQLISIKKNKIEKLNEYKKSLIYEAVTGKIEVM